ncbi:hypothetical protein BTVI_29582 [Pitangus sulphuratus]|nr:hypothetical protein BTVI_29582 [Pitangus sulphuratus]
MDDGSVKTYLNLPFRSVLSLLLETHGNTWASGKLMRINKAKCKKANSILHQKNCGQQVKEDDSVSLLCRCETPPGAVALETSAEEGRLPIGTSAEEGQGSGVK